MSSFIQSLKNMVLIIILEFSLIVFYFSSDLKKMAEFSYIKRESEKLIHAIQGNLFKLDKHGEIWLK